MGVGIDDRSKLRLESRKVGSALGVVDIVTISEDVFMELVDILKSTFNKDSLVLSGKIANIGNSLVLAFI